MEQQLSTTSSEPMQYSLWLFALAAAALAVCWQLASTTRRRSLPLPPGPAKLPLIGNMLMMDQMTHRGLARLAQRYGGLLHLRLGFSHTVVVSSPDVAREVLQVHDAVCANRPATAAIRYLTYDRSDMAFAHYGPFWRQMRKLCVMKLFSRKRAESWASVRDEVDAAVRAVALAAQPGGAPVNVGKLVFGLTMNITYRAAFGSTAGGDAHGEFLSILQEFSMLFGIFNVADFIPWLEPLDLQGINRRLRAARGSLDRFIDRVIDEHLANPKPADDPNYDMVDEMLAFLGDGAATSGGDDAVDAPFRINRDHIKAIIMVTVKAVMLDEIINYVQPLQRQVEFLSMKLAAVSPQLDINIERLISKEIFQAQAVHEDRDSRNKYYDTIIDIRFVAGWKLSFTMNP